MATRTPKIQGVNSQFPGCCGATILHELSGSTEELARHAPQTQSAQFATTVPSQVIAIEALEAAKFIPLVTWENSNTHNEVTLWGRGVEKV